MIVLQHTVGLLIRLYFLWMIYCNSHDIHSELPDSDGEHVEELSSLNKPSQQHDAACRGEEDKRLKVESQLLKDA